MMTIGEIMRRVKETEALYERLYEQMACAKNAAQNQVNIPTVDLEDCLDVVSDYIRIVMSKKVDL